MSDLPNFVLSNNSFSDENAVISKCSSEDENTEYKLSLTVSSKKEYKELIEHINKKFKTDLTINKDNSSFKKEPLQENINKTNVLNTLFDKFNKISFYNDIEKDDIIDNSKIHEYNFGELLLLSTFIYHKVINLKTNIDKILIIGKKFNNIIVPLLDKDVVYIKHFSNIKNEIFIYNEKYDIGLSRDICLNINEPSRLELLINLYPKYQHRILVWCDWKAYNDKIIFNLIKNEKINPFEFHEEYEDDINKNISFYKHLKLIYKEDLEPENKIIVLKLLKKIKYFQNL
jgi:hypothetical protein